MLIFLLFNFIVKLEICAETSPTNPTSDQLILSFFASILNVITLGFVGFYLLELEDIKAYKIINNCLDKDSQIILNIIDNGLLFVNRYITTCCVLLSAIIILIITEYFVYIYFISDESEHGKRHSCKCFKYQASTNKKSINNIVEFVHMDEIN